MGLTGWCDVVVRGGSFDVVVMWCEEGLMAMGLTAAGNYQSEKKKKKKNERREAASMES
jgi:hypothetical protein